jgi:hypothetical protein
VEDDEITPEMIEKVRAILDRNVQRKIELERAKYDGILGRPPAWVGSASRRLGGMT